MDDKIYTMKVSPETNKTLQELATNLNITVEKVIAKALFFMQMAQGRTVTLKNKDGSFDVNDFSSLPSTIKIQKK